MAKKNKFYAVRKGRQVGVYLTWAECQEQTVGFKGAEFLSTKTEEEAWKFINEGVKPVKKEKDPNKGEIVDVLEVTKELSSNPEITTVYVDGSSLMANNPENELGYDRYSFGMVVVRNNEIVHEANGEGTSRNAASLNNVAGELLGSMKAVLYAINVEKTKKVVIIHDYTGVADWVTGAWKAKNDFTQSYVAFMDKCKANIEIEFVKVAGHSKNKFNNRADNLARAALGLAPR